ncbi:MAG TPA: AMP-binding protein, partial [Rubrobacteraceae bacterium]|nr:AMP-binding protein [Rubrobacteraceae bacterium]
MNEAVSRPSTYVQLLITDGVRRTARCSPRKIALQENDRTLSYGDLNDSINRLANLATDGFGLRKGDRVALLAHNCLEFAEILLGMASAGIVTAVVSPRNTPEEVALICDDAEARVLFVHEQLAEVAQAIDLVSVEQIIVIDDEYERLVANARASQPTVPLSERDTFCILFTSGSTGVPKGVLVPHRQRTLASFSIALGCACYTPDERALGISPMYHGGGFQSTLTTLFFGGYTAVMPRFDPEEALRLISDRKLTSAYLVPTHLNAIFALGDEALARFDTRSFRRVISNGAPLSLAAKEKVIEHFGDDALFEVYGSTDGGLVSILQAPDQLRKAQSAGLPAPGVEIRLLDERGDEVPRGEAGELLVRSPYLSNGYWRRQAETERAFRDGWFSSEDIARLDDEGFIYLVDRRDSKIITGGVNVYPREVEEVLERHPAVLEVAVFGIPDNYWGEAVHAVLVLRPGITATPEEIGSFCRERLAAPKRPKA